MAETFRDLHAKPADLSDPNFADLTRPGRRSLAPTGARPAVVPSAEAVGEAPVRVRQPIAAVAPRQPSPERVRFNTSATVKQAGRDGPSVEGALLNLSAHGVAFCGEARLQVGDKVEVSFRLALGEEPVAFLSDVIWVHHQTPASVAAGLRFRGLTPADEERIAAVVRERTEGRAGAWPLPIWPNEAKATGRRGAAAGAPMRPWVAGAMGMAVGSGLTLALAFLFGGSAPVTPGAELAALADEAARSMPLVAAPAGRLGEAVGAPANSDAGGGAAAVVPAPVPEAASAVAADTTADGAPVPVASPSPGQQVEADSPTLGNHGAPGGEASAGREPAAALAVGRGEALNVKGTSDGVLLELLTDGPVDNRTSFFWLKQPRRLVVDIAERRAVSGPTVYESLHPLLGRIRVGQHEKKVRFVIETVDAMSDHVVLQPRGHTVRVKLSKWVKR